MTPPANELHAKLRAYTLTDAIRLVEAMVRQHGYNVMFHDPGVRAWVEENQGTLRPIAQQRRAERQGTFGQRR